MGLPKLFEKTTSAANDTLFWSLTSYIVYSGGLGPVLRLHSIGRLEMRYMPLEASAPLQVTVGQG